jgi:hypothetical protein
MVRFPQRLGLRDIVACPPEALLYLSMGSNGVLKSAIIQGLAKIGLAVNSHLA